MVYPDVEREKNKLNYILQYILQLLKQKQEKTTEMSEQYINPFDEYVSSFEEELSLFVSPNVSYLEENTSLKEELRETKARLAKLEEQMAILMDRSRLCPIVKKEINYGQPEYLTRFIDLDCQEIKIYFDNGQIQITIGSWVQYIRPFLYTEQEEQLEETYRFMRALHNIQKITLTFYVNNQNERKKYDTMLYYACNMIKLLVDRNMNIDINMENYRYSGSSYYCDLNKIFKQIDHHKINTIIFDTRIPEPEKQEIRDTITECNPGFLDKIVFTVL